MADVRMADVKAWMLELLTILLLDLDYQPCHQISKMAIHIPPFGLTQV